LFLAEPARRLFFMGVFSGAAAVNGDLLVSKAGEGLV
jgi:hypothetical protein